MLDALKACVTNQTFTDGAQCVGGTLVEGGRSAVSTLWSAAASNPVISIPATAAVVTSAYLLKTRGKPTVESVKGHLATAASYLDPREYNVVKSRMKPKTA